MFKFFIGGKESLFFKDNSKQNININSAIIIITWRTIRRTPKLYLSHLLKQLQPILEGEEFRHRRISVGLKSQRYGFPTGEDREGFGTGGLTGWSFTWTHQFGVGGLRFRGYRRSLGFFLRGFCRFKFRGFSLFGVFNDLYSLGFRCWLPFFSHVVWVRNKKVGRYNRGLYLWGGRSGQNFRRWYSGWGRSWYNSLLIMIILMTSGILYHKIV